MTKGDTVTTATTVTITPTYYYTVNNPNDPIAVTQTALRKAEHLLLEQAVPEFEEDFFEILTNAYALSTGCSRPRAAALFMAIYQLHDLPRLNKFQHELFHLDTNRLITISHGVAGLHHDHLGVMDEHLTEYLTPQAPNQALPSSRQITAKINAIRLLVEDDDCDEDGEGENPPESKNYFHLTHHGDGTAEIYAQVDSLQGQAIKDAVEAYAQAMDITKGDAFPEVILDKVNLKVVLNLYQATDLAHAPVWANGPDWVDEATAKKWVAKATTTQDMDKARYQQMKGHDPSPAMRAAVKGRDGGCTSPGCGVPSKYCDLDHRINFDDGGETSFWNFCELCRGDHNAKTHERQRYCFDPYTGVKITVFMDGAWAVTVPEGPLTPGGARWAQTVSQYREARHKRARARAAAKAKATKATEFQVTRPAQEDEPPF